MRDVAGERIGDYELLFTVGEGGMGTVFLARRRAVAGFERLVVVKRMHRHLGADPQIHAMLADEARLSSRIHHPNVVAALDVVEHDSELALVLEYVDGVPLSELLRAPDGTPRALRPDIATRILLDVLAGLHAAHEATDLDGMPLDIVHRDVSPQNILVGRDGLSRLIDFGIARATERNQQTQTGVLKGKLRYMSPEQARHKPIDRRSDVFSAAAVLFEAWCGRPLLQGESDVSLLLELLVQDVPDVTASGGDHLPDGARAVLRRGLAVDADERYESAQAFRTALENEVPAAGHRAVGDEVMAVAGARLDARRAAVARASNEVDASAKRAARSARTRRVGAAALLVTLLAAPAIAWWWGARGASMTNGTPRTTPAAEPTPAVAPAPQVRSAEETSVAAAPPATASSTDPAKKADVATRNPLRRPPHRDTPKRLPPPAPSKAPLHGNPYP